MINIRMHTSAKIVLTNFSHVRLYMVMSTLHISEEDLHKPSSES